VCSSRLALEQSPRGGQPLLLMVMAAMTMAVMMARGVCLNQTVSRQEQANR
jgi:hypothetical protein